MARTDSVEVPAFAEHQFLVDSTKSLSKAKFLPPDPNASNVSLVVQKVTGLVADGEVSTADASKRYESELKQAVGGDNVVAGS